MSAATAADAGSVFADLMRLTPVGADDFVAPLAPESAGRMYGGQLLAQGLMACAATVDVDRDVHSLHAYFLRPGAVDEPMTLSVERIRDGRGFSARCVRAQQRGRELFRMLASFHVPEPGDAYAHAVAPPVPPPEEVAVTYVDFVRAEGGAEGWYGDARPMDIRYVNAPTSSPGVPVLDSQKTWMRIAGTLPDDARLQAAALAYLVDSTLIDHVALVHGKRWSDPRLEGASLDHAMWFQRRARADAWLLFDQQVESTGAARGLASGRVFTADGTLVATCMQEGLTRWS